MERWGACCSTGKVCHCAFVRLRDVKAVLAQRILSARGAAAAEEHGCVHLVRMNANRSEVGKAKPRSRLHIENLHFWDEKQNRWNSCPVLNAARTRVISDKIDQNYIIGFYGPLKT